MRPEAIKVGRQGTVVIPAELRRRYAIEEGGYVVLEARDDGILIRPAALLPIETYPAERRAEFLLTNAVDREDYERAVDEVRQMGLDPDAVPHRAPADGA